LVPALAGIVFAILVSVLGQAPSRAATAPLAISISGNHFVNGAGQTIRLLGVNHTSSEYGCVDGFGYDDGHFDDADAAAIASWGANAVRIPLNEDCWLGINGQPNSSEGADPPLTQAGYQTEIKNYVADLNAHGIYAILDLHWAAPGAQVPLEQQPMPDLDHSAAFWSSVATTFKSNPAVVFDLYNEPYDPHDMRSGDDPNPDDAVTWDCWDMGTINGTPGGPPCFTQAYDENNNPTARYKIAGLQSLLDAIRAAGATQPVMSGGLDYANDLGETNGGGDWMNHAPDDPLNQEAASFHNYQGKGCDNQTCWDNTIAKVAANVPVVTGEFAEDNYLAAGCNATPGSDTFDDRYMTWADTNSVSYVSWAWLVDDPPQPGDDPCSRHGLLSAYDGTPIPPNGTAVHDHLTALAAGGGTISTTSSSTTTSKTTTSRTTTSATTSTATTTTTGANNPPPAPKLASFSATVKVGGGSVGFTLRSSENSTGTLTGQTATAFATTAAKHRRQKVSLGTVHFKLSAGKSKTVVLKLSKASRGLLAKRHSLKVQITVTLTNSAKRRSVSHRTLTLKTPARRRH
jgi:hypothetical protein